MAIDWNRPVQTRRGHKVEIKDRKLSSRFSVLGVIERADGTREFETWTDEGEARLNGSHPDDLINAPVRVERWENDYGPYSVRSSFNTKADANTFAGDGRTALIRSVYEGERLVSVALEDV